MENVVKKRDSCTIKDVGNPDLGNPDDNNSEESIGFTVPWIKHTVSSRMVMSKTLDTILCPAS